MPDASTISDRIKLNNKFYPYFKDCLGALDGSHIPINVPSKQQHPWRNRKGFLSQNVLAVVDFNMNFSYVLPGWEGTAHDSRVLADAKSRGFSAPSGKFFLADAGYSGKDPILLTPYQGVRYHLDEQYRAAQRPSNAKELFNLRHASLRNVVERVFGVFKQRFKIFEAGRAGFKIEDMVQLVYALTAVHNFMNMNGSDPAEEVGGETFQDPILNAPLVEIGGSSLSEEVEMCQRRRDIIAGAMWVDYEKYVEQMRRFGSADM